MMKWFPLHRDWLFAIVVSVACLLLAVVDLANVPKAPRGEHARARVVDVDNSHVRVNLIVKTNAQVLTVELLDGARRGERMTVTNMLMGNMEMDEFYETGAVILVEYNEAEGKIVHAMARGHYRLRLQIVLIVLFAGLLLVVSGVTGIKAILSFLFSALVLWKLYFPLLLRHYPPIVTGLGIVAITTAVITFSVGGVDRRGVSTFLGSMLGVLLTCGLAILFSRALHLHGAVRPYAESLLYSGHIHLRITDMFIASIFIGSSGAVMDLAMDIAATMDEIKRAKPQISLRDHIASGLRVGRAVVGTMTTTLLLAYSGTHVAMFLLFMSKGLPPQNIFNSTFIAAEVLNILVGSFGVVAVAPFTALVAGIIYRTAPPSANPATTDEIEL